MNVFLTYLPANIWGFILLGAVFVLALLFLFRLKKTEWLFYILLVWFPLEGLFLRWTPIKYYAYVKYFPEIVLYGFAFLAWFFFLKHKGGALPRTPLNKWLFCLIIIALISLLLNWYSPAVWILGMRQVLRFVLTFFLILFLQYPRRIIKKLVWLAVFMIVLEAALGIVQYASGGGLDKYLFSSQIVTIGNRAVIGGEEEFWAAGSRVFATMGRYDRLGGLIALGLALFFPFAYHLENSRQKLLYCIAMGIGVLALFLTSSRASWIGAVCGVLFIGVVLTRDKRILWTALGCAAILAVYLFGFALIRTNLMSITEKPTQSTAERVFEAVSLRAWRESYEGYGRIFFIVNTPMVVVPSAPFFGVGPGNYGGGAAAALLNTKAYDRLHLPFGIQNTYGQIDNSWFSIWGEFGTLGLICFIGIFAVLIKSALQTAKKSFEPWAAGLAQGLAGASIGLMVMGFFGPYFEFRSLMFYFWTFAGIVMLFCQEQKRKGNFLPPTHFYVKNTNAN